MSSWKVDIEVGDVLFRHNFGSVTNFDGNFPHVELRFAWIFENQSKSAGEEGAVIYLWSMIKESKAEFIMEGVVSGFLDHGIEVLLHAVGQTVQ